jgi:hypothetical protein
MLPATSDPGLTELEGMVLVMEYVDGPSLSEMIRAQGLLDDVSAARVWVGWAGARRRARARCDAPRRQARQHRDGRGRMAHLIDFGIARAPATPR